MTHAPRPTRAGRLVDYLGEMFPPLVQVPAAAVTFLAVYFCLQRLDGRSHLVIGWLGLGAALTLLAFTLLLRTYDELKDVETDLRLGRAGDPRYRDRAIVTGRVLPEDLVALRWGTTIALFALNVGLGWPWPGAAFVGVFALTWLSFRWFFWPQMSRHLLIAFATHNPLSLALGAYLLAVYAREFGHFPPPTAWLLLLGMWMPVAAWETARKIRVPADETDYLTYSRVLGWRVAAALPLSFVAVSVASLVLFGARAGLGRWLVLALGAGALPLVAGVVRLWVAPSSRAANLRPLAELYALACGSCLLAAAVASADSVSLSP